MKRPGPLLPVILVIFLLAGCGCQAPAPGSLQAPAAHNNLSDGHSAGVPLDPATSTPAGFPVGRWQYVFNDSRGNADRPITVYTYRPAAWNLSGPVLIVIPGAGRDGGPPRETWIPSAERYASLLVVPEFSQQYYPGDLWYAGGNTFDATNWQPRRNWTYLAIEHLFDDIKERSGATSPAYLLDGHSAGAQFVHRLVLLVPEARYSRAVAANAGVYLLPNYSVPYGFGLKDSPLPESRLPEVLSHKLIILSGGSDTDPNAAGLANFPAAEAQGSNRFERARFFYTTAGAEAKRLHVPLNWEYSVIPGVGHDEAGMAGPSAERLFTGT